jgi:AcrR family transcriptional regulator
MGLARYRKSCADSGAAEAQPAKPLDVRTRLLQAADDILVGEGLQALTQTRVAEAAGVRQSHLTYYFETRSALIRSIIEYTASSLLAQFTDDAGGGRISLPELRRRLMESLSDRRIARRMMGILVSTDEDPSLMAVLVEIESRHCASMAQTIRGLGVELSDQDVMLLHSSLIGILLRYSNRNTKAARQQAKALIGEAFDRVVANARTTARRPTRQRAAFGTRGTQDVGA